MKKYFVLFLVLAFLFTFTAAPKTVSAIIETPEPKLEGWEWYAEGVTGEEIPMVKITTTPRDWYQLKTTGLKVDGATKICHGFDAGRYGWTGEIFRLIEDTWVKLPTTVGWVPTEEGHYMACAMAPAAGTYALFGYFDKSKAPVVEKELPECGNWGAGIFMSPDQTTYYNFIIGFESTGFANIPVTYQIINSNYPLSGDLTATVLADLHGTADFTGYQWQVIGPITTRGNFIIHVETPKCYTDILIGFGSGGF